MRGVKDQECRREKERDRERDIREDKKEHRERERIRNELDHVGQEAGVRGDFGAREWRTEGSAELALPAPHDEIQTHALPTLSSSKHVPICSVIATLTCP